jgi:hypothetical protein
VVCRTNGFFFCCNHLPHPPRLDGKHASYIPLVRTALWSKPKVQLSSIKHSTCCAEILLWDRANVSLTGPNSFESNEWNCMSIIAPSQKCSVHSPGTVPLQLLTFADQLSMCRSGLRERCQKWS